MGGSGQRKRMFVDGKVQGAIIRRILLHWFLACVVMSLYLLALEMLSRGMQGPLSSHLEAMWQRYAPLFIAVLTLFPVFAYDTVRMSHRFAGPMISLKRNLRLMAEKQSVTELKFRKGDFWHELTEDLNRVAEHLGLVQPATAQRDPNIPT